MKKKNFLLISLSLLLFLFSCSVENEPARVLIIQDEKPQMEILRDFLETNSSIAVTIVSQDSLPEDFSQYNSVIGYIHRGLAEPAEVRIIDYTRSGGRYICLHHSISSGKAKNKYYFDFLGIRLDDAENSRHPVLPGGGYGWTHGGEEGITLTIVNLNRDHYITNHRITWGEEIEYISSDSPSAAAFYPSLSFEKSEIYMNHKFTDGREKTVLAGYKFFDERNNQLFMQDRAVWIKPVEAGEIIYFKMGHSSAEFENQNFSRMILNSIQWKDNRK